MDAGRHRSDYTEPDKFLEVKDALDKALDTLNDAEDRLKFISRDNKIKSILKDFPEDYKKKILAIMEE